MTTIAVVQCGSAKRATACRARDLYIGSLFRALRGAAERIADRWYIASAKHGIIEPSRILRPYDVTLRPNDRAWGEAVHDQLLELEPNIASHRLVAFCSARYLVGWAAELRAETPIKGLSMGRAMQAATRIGRGP